MKVAYHNSSWGAFLVASSYTGIMTASAFQSPFLTSKMITNHLGSLSSPTNSMLGMVVVDAYGMTVVDVDENASRDIGTFEEWASSYGVQKCDGFQLTSENGGLDVSAMTTMDIPAQSPVLYVPNEMILKSSEAQQEFGRFEVAEQRLVSSKSAHHIPYFYLFLKVLKEYEMGDQSVWFSWLNSLPRYYSNGASMTPFCFDCLPPLVGLMAKKDRIRFIQFFQALKFVDTISEDSKSRKDLAKWAFSVVHTRCFESNGDILIVPMADMLNHGTDTEVETSFDEQGNYYGYSKYDIPAGYPLRISYGDHTNPSRLFARYGFMDRSSPATFCKIMINRPSKELVNMGYDHSKMLFYKDTGEVSDEVWDVLLYQILEGNDPNQLPAFYNAHMNGDYATKQSFHENYYPQTFAALQNHVDTFLYSLDNLTAQTAGSDVNEHPRLPLITEHNEFVKETFLKVKANLANM